MSSESKRKAAGAKRLEALQALEDDASWRSVLSPSNRPFHGIDDLGYHASPSIPCVPRPFLPTSLCALRLVAVPTLQRGRPGTPPRSNPMFGVEHHDDWYRPRSRREVCVHEVEIRVAGKNPQFDTSRFSQTRDQRNDTETVAAPVLAQYQDPHLARRAQSRDQPRRNGRRPIHPLPDFRVLRNRRQVRRKSRRCLVAGRIDRECHRDGVTPIGPAGGRREYRSVNVSVWLRSTSVPFGLKMTCSRKPTSVRQLRVRR